MTTRSDVVQDFNPSPRISEVKQPSTEFIAQDVVDTLRKKEDSFRGTSETRLLDASGKQNLGGGVQVGITVELKDNQIAFEGRTTPAQSGTVTTNSSAPVSGTIKLIDSAATFITNLIARGSLIINYDDRSVAEVISVDSETQVTCKTLANGTSNTFTISDVYDVFNIVQCNILGGNVVATDEFGAEISPVLPTAFTQVVRTSSSSATISNQTSLEHSAFQGVVTLDVANGVAGTAFPIGTGGEPVNNIADAKIIAANNFFRTIHVLGSFIVGATDVLDNHRFIGQGKTVTTFTFIAGCSTGDVTFEDMTLTGDASGAMTAFRCLIFNLSGVGCTTNESHLIDCEHETGFMQIRADNNKKIHLSQSESGSAGVVTPPDIDVNGSFGDITIHKYGGTFQISNMTQNIQVSFDTAGGAFTINASCVAGTIALGGATKIIDNSGPGCTIVNNTTPRLVWTDNDSVDAIAILNTLSFLAESVWLDENAGTAGTAYPKGTVTNPVNNMSDAIIIALANGLRKIQIVEDCTLLATDDVSGFTISGSNAAKSQITVTPGANTTLTQFFECFLTGTLDGQVVVRNALVEDLIGFQGILHQVVILGFVRLVASPQPSHILSCYSGVPGTQTPELDFDGVDVAVGFRDYNGGIKLVNKTGAKEMSLDIASGQVKVDGTCSGGIVVIRGDAIVTDTSAAGCTVVDQSTPEYVWKTESGKGVLFKSVGKNITNPVTGEYELYDLNDVLFKKGNAFQDAAGTIAYNNASTQIERVDKLI